MLLYKAFSITLDQLWLTRTAEVGSTGVVALALFGFPIRFAGSEQIGPIVGWAALSQHLLEDSVRIGLAAGRSERMFIVDPGKNDDSAPGIETEK